MHSLGIEAQRRTIGKVTGAAPESCPWRAFDDELVGEVIEAHSWDETGQLSMWLGVDPPNLMVEAMHTFRVALGRARSHLRKEQGDKRERERKRG